MIAAGLKFCLFLMPSPGLFLDHQTQFVYLGKLATDGDPFPVAAILNCNMAENSLLEQEVPFHLEDLFCRLSPTEEEGSLSMLTVLRTIHLPNSILLCDMPKFYVEVAS